VTDSPVVKIELVCQNEKAKAVIELIIANGKTGELGDGSMVLSNIADAFKIKTGTSLKQCNK
jgi:nitrogen regulatory protein P-II 1